MAGLINDLIDILKKQATNYEELLILSEEKRKVIIENNIDMLQKITQAENVIIGRNQRMETKRLEIMKNIASVLNYNQEILTVSALAELIREQNEYGELVEIKDTLKATLDALKAENDRNNVLLNSSIDYINFTVNLLRSSTEDDSYPRQRKSTPGDSKGFFDVKR